MAACSSRAVVVEREAARLGLGEHALGDQVPEHGVQRAGVAAGRGRELVDRRDARVDVVGDPQVGHHVDAPRRLEVGQRLEVGHA